MPRTWRADGLSHSSTSSRREATATLLVAAVFLYSNITRDINSHRNNTTETSTNISGTTPLGFIGGWLDKVRNVHDANSSCIFCLDTPVLNSCCSSCQARMPVILRACRLCALPLEYTLNGDANNARNARQGGISNYSQDELGYLCPTCYHKPPVVDFLWSPYTYYAPLSKSLHLMKFSRLIYYGFVLGNLWKQMYLQPQGDNKPSNLIADLPHLIVPIPLHSQRQGTRGFNQSVELITPLMNLLGIPMSHGNDALCLRTKATEPQLNLSPQERSKNIRNAFAINKKSSHYAKLRGKTILLVDDVVTTGATINELAKCLKKAGVAKVIAWSLLRA